MGAAPGGRDGGDGATVRIQATCVAVGGEAVLLRGPPGSGKSDLAFRLIAEPPPAGQPLAHLVGDDQVIVRREGQRLVARGPEQTAGILEIRGVGLRRVPFMDAARLALIVDLAAPDTVPRLPADPLPTEDVLGLPVPLTRLAPFEASAPLKLRALLGAWGPSAV